MVGSGPTPAQDMALLKESDAVVVGSQDVLGFDVHDQSNQPVGTVDDLVVDRETLHVRYLVVGEGGIAGLGRRRRLVPVDVIEDVASETVFLRVDHQRAAAAPEGVSLEPEDIERVCESWGCRPHWSEGYVAPEWGKPEE